MGAVPPRQRFAYLTNKPENIADTTDINISSSC